MIGANKPPVTLVQVLHAPRAPLERQSRLVGLVWFGFVFGLVWFGFGLVWFVFGLVLVWFGLVWFWFYRVLRDPGRLWFVGCRVQSHKKNGYLKLVQMKTGSITGKTGPHSQQSIKRYQLIQNQFMQELSDTIYRRYIYRRRVFSIPQGGGRSTNQPTRGA